ncbi:MAG: hypothetical protein AAF662_00075 [Pseudomonadota bacterium]
MLIDLLGNAGLERIRRIVGLDDCCYRDRSVYLDPESVLSPDGRNNSAWDLLNCAETELVLETIREKVRDGSIYGHIQSCDAQHKELGSTIWVLGEEA